MQVTEFKFQADTFAKSEECDIYAYEDLCIDKISDGKITTRTYRNSFIRESYIDLNTLEGAYITKQSLKNDMKNFISNFYPYVLSDLIMDYVGKISSKAFSLAGTKFKEDESFDNYYDSENERYEECGIYIFNEHWFEEFARRNTCRERVYLENIRNEYKESIKKKKNFNIFLPSYDLKNILNKYYRLSGECCYFEGSLQKYYVVKLWGTEDITFTVEEKIRGRIEYSKLVCFLDISHKNKLFLAVYKYDNKIIFDYHNIFVIIKFKN